jgi:hypothetical protein
LGDVDLVADDSDAKRGDEAFFLHEGMGGICFAIAISVFDHRDAVSSRASSSMAAVIDSFADPDPSGMIDVHVGGVEKLRSGGPNGDFEVVGKGEEIGGHGSGFATVAPRNVRRSGVRLEKQGKQAERGSK